MRRRFHIFAICAYAIAILTSFQPASAQSPASSDKPQWQKCSAGLKDVHRDADGHLTGSALSEAYLLHGALSVISDYWDFIDPSGIKIEITDARINDKPVWKTAAGEFDQAIQTVPGNVR